MHINHQTEEKSHSLLSFGDLSQSLGMNPCASSNPSPDIRKPNINASHCALHPATCHPKINQRSCLTNCCCQYIQETRRRQHMVQNMTLVSKLSGPKKPIHGLNWLNLCLIASLKKVEQYHQLHSASRKVWCCHFFNLFITVAFSPFFHSINHIRFH